MQYVESVVEFKVVRWKDEKKMRKSRIEMKCRMLSNDMPYSMSTLFSEAVSDMIYRISTFVFL